MADGAHLPSPAAALGEAPDQHPGVEPFRPTLSTLFNMALSHGEPLRSGILERWAYDRFFAEVELTDTYFSRTGVSSLVLHCLWDRFRDEATDRMTADGFFAVIHEVCRRCYHTMSGKLNSPDQQQPPSARATPALLTGPPATLKNPLSKEALSPERGASFLSSPDKVPSAAEIEASKEFAFALEFVFSTYIQKSVFQPNAPHVVEESAEWSHLTRDVVTHAIRIATPAVQLFFDEYSDAEGFLGLSAFVSMLRAMGITKDYVDDDIIEPIFHQVNTEDTKGLEHGEVFDEIELDLVISALGLMAFAAFSDDTLYPRHVTIQSRMYSFFEVITNTAAARFDTLPFVLPVRFAIGEMSSQSIPRMEPFAVFDERAARRVETLAPLDPVISVVVPRVLSLSVLEGFFVAGAHFLTPTIDESALIKDLPWESLLGRKNRTTRLVTHRLKEALREAQEAQEEARFALQRQPTMEEYSSSVASPTGHGVSPLQQMMDDEEAEEQRIRDARAKEDAMAKSLFLSAGNAAHSGTVLRDAQWLMTGTFDPSLAALHRDDANSVEKVVVWCGGVVIAEAYCVSSNRVRATPTPACLTSMGDVGVITGAVRSAERLDITFQPAQRVAVQISRGVEGVKSRPVSVVLSRTSLRGQHVGGRDAAVFHRIFELHSTEALSGDTSQRYMSWSEFEQAKKLLELPEATNPPKFPFSAQRAPGGKLPPPSSASWATLFDMFGAPLPVRDPSDPRKPVPRTTLVTRCPDEIAKVVHRGGIPSPSIGAKSPVLTIDGFLLTVLYGIAGSIMDQRASALSAELLVIRLKALMSYPQVRAAAVPPPPPPPLASSMTLSPEVSVHVPAPSASKKKKSGRSKSVSKSEGAPKSKDGKAKKGKGKKKKDTSPPPAPLPQGPQPILLPASAFQGTPHRRLYPVISFTSPRFIDDAYHKVIEENPPSQHLKMVWKGDDDGTQTEQAQHLPVLVEPTPPPRDVGSPSPRRRLHLLEDTNDQNQNRTARLKRDLLDGTTAKLEPLDVATPRRGERLPGRPDDLLGMDEVHRPSLATSPITVPAIVHSQLSERVKHLSADLRKEYFTSPSMLQVQNHPQYSLKSFY